MEVNDKERRYLEFASNITFFEFLQDEFWKPDFRLEDYSLEITGFEKKKEWTPKELTDFVMRFPRIFDVFEEIFQLSRFTNTQISNFLFDVNILNSLNREDQIKYLKENIKNDDEFERIFNKLSEIDFGSNEELKLLTNFKRAIVVYLESSIKNHQLIYNRLSNKQLNCSERFSIYLIKNLDLNNVIKGISIREYLKNKRIPKDTKSLHGKFGNIKISNLLEKKGIKNLDKQYPRKSFGVLPHKLPSLKKEDIFFLTERYIKDVAKMNSGKFKRFDFVIIKDSNPSILIETNYYSTSGTKIGINEDEYLLLDKEIKNNFPKFKFLWITDGIYWLSSDGKNRLFRLMDIFNSRILNYNLLEKEVESLF